MGFRAMISALSLPVRASHIDFKLYEQTMASLRFGFDLDTDLESGLVWHLMVALSLQLAVCFRACRTNSHPRAEKCRVRRRPGTDRG